MTINVYPSIMPGDPEEVYHDHGMTIEQWLMWWAGDYYRPGAQQPVSCTVNGRVVPPAEWSCVTIRQRDVVDFRVTPRGDAFGGILGAVFPVFALNVAAFDALTGLFTPGIPGQGGSGRQGQQISPADARANTARLGEGVPELFGRYIRYPDYLNQPRRFYADTTTQVLRLLLSVGVGSYDVDPDTVQIGETPISDLDGVSYQLFEPGEDLSGLPHHENWYNAPEVGSTESSTGIRLKGVTESGRTYDDAGVSSGQTISSIDTGEYWAPGVEGAVRMRQVVTSTENPDPMLSDPITGNFQHLEVGLTVDVVAGVGLSLPDGQYVVESLNAGKTELTLETTGGDPVNDLPATTSTMEIDKAGTRYRITSVNSGSSIDVERVLTNGDPDPDWSVLPTLTDGSSNFDIAWDPDTMVGFKAGPYAACPDGEVTDRFEIDIFAVQGLGIVDGEDIDPRSRTIRIEWREIGGTTWNVQDEVVSGQTRDQLGWTFGVDLPSAIRPEVLLGRVGGESVAVTSLDRLECTALRARLPTVTSYPGITVMAVTILGTDEIGSQSNNRINLEPVRKLPPVAGGTPTATRSIARAACYVARSLEYDDDQIDIDEFERLDDIWNARGDYFDYVFNDLTAKEALDTILRAGFAVATIDTGAIVPVREEPRTTFEQGYSPENMTAPLQRNFTGPTPDETDGVEVEYTKADTWTTETVKCFLPGDQGIKLDKVKLDGVTDRTRAWRIGMRRRRAQRYRRYEYSFSTELDALNSSYLSYVPLLDDVPGFGAVSIMESIEPDSAYGARITVSEPLEWFDGQTHVVAYRDPEGYTVGPFTAYQGDSADEILADIPEPWPEISLKQEPPHVFFGTSERWSWPALITEIRPSGPRSVSVSATNYDDRVYADDDATPPA
ncbi:host specificity factor TipJ family phage tail protein [Marinobacter sp. M1N3S26]|uniref:host specificity factor TipJ family phage tail protein n=1 Tax=Marinobacter sp. M1N3S26 TaxID=3382299 RepID=UPI00387ADB87